MDTEEHVDRVAWAVRDLVRHLERQATEHVHALDALRAEVEALRTQNAHLRALQAATEAKPVREVVRGKYGVFFHNAMWQAGCSIEAEDGRCAVNWSNQPNTWMPYDRKSNALHDGLTEPEAIAWVLDGVLPKR